MFAKLYTQKLLSQHDEEERDVSNNSTKKAPCVALFNGEQGEALEGSRSSIHLKPSQDEMPIREKCEGAGANELKCEKEGDRQKDQPSQIQPCAAN